VVHAPHLAVPLSAMALSRRADTIAYVTFTLCPATGLDHRALRDLVARQIDDREIECAPATPAADRLPAIHVTVYHERTRAALDPGLHRFRYIRRLLAALTLAAAISLALSVPWVTEQAVPR
jgi:hypothetical protein